MRGQMLLRLLVALLGRGGEQVRGLGFVALDAAALVSIQARLYWASASP